MAEDSRPKTRFTMVDRDGRPRTGWLAWLRGGRALPVGDTCWKCGFHLTNTPGWTCPKCGEDHRAGRCFRCGYDLTGLQGDVCPECGFNIRIARDVLRHHGDHHAPD